VPLRSRFYSRGSRRSVGVAEKLDPEFQFENPTVSPDPPQRRARELRQLLVGVTTEDSSAQ
jgi:hypothetical protein